MKKRTVLLAIIIVLFSSQIYAKSKYVTDTMMITLRTGPDISFRVIGHVSSGESVSVVESKDKWTRVNAPDGKEGWVLTRFLTDEEPTKDVLERLKKNYDALKAKTKNLKEENENLKNENREISSKRYKETKNLEKITKKYDSLKTESADFLSLKKRHQAMTIKYETLKEELNRLKQEKAVLESNHYLWGFGLGVGVLLLGYLAGRSARRQRSSRLI